MEKAPKKYPSLKEVAPVTLLKKVTSSRSDWPAYSIWLIYLPIYTRLFIYTIYTHRYQEEMLARVMELHQLARAGGGQAPGGMLAM